MQIFDFLILLFEIPKYELLFVKFNCSWIEFYHMSI